MGENDINIDNVSDFEARQESVNRWLETICNYGNDIAINSNTIYNVCNGIEEKLSSFSYETLDGEVVSFSKTLAGQEDVMSITNELMDFLKINVAKAQVGMKYTYNKIMGYTMSTETENEILRFLRSTEKVLDEIGVFWIIKGVLKSTGNPNLEALGFTLAYGHDAAVDGGDFFVGDNGAELWKEFFGKEFSIPESTEEIWYNARVGGLLVVLFETGKEAYILGQDGWDDYSDLNRSIATGVVAGLDYAAWTVIAGSIGGPAGAAVAGLALIPLHYLLNEAKDQILGDDVVDVFYLDGVRYEVYGNGKGKQGDIQALAHQYRNDYLEYLMDNNYVEWLKQDIGYLDLRYNHVTEDDLYDLQQVLEKIQNATSIETAEEIWEEWYYLEDRTEGKQKLLEILRQKGFDMEEYYENSHQTIVTSIPVYDDFTSVENISERYSENAISSFQTVLRRLKNAKSTKDVDVILADFFEFGTTEQFQLYEELKTKYKFNFETYFIYTHTNVG